VSEKIFETLNPASGVYFTGTLVERRQTPYQLLEVYDTPELGRMFRLDGATLDVYVCNYTSDNTGKAEAVYAELVKALKPADVLVERVMRGRDLPLKKRVA